MTPKETTIGRTSHNCRYFLQFSPYRFSSNVVPRTRSRGAPVPLNRKWSKAYIFQKYFLIISWANQKCKQLYIDTLDTMWGSAFAKLVAEDKTVPIPCGYSSLHCCAEKFSYPTRRYAAAYFPAVCITFSSDD